MGTVTIDGKPMTIGYAYAIDHQQNEANHRKDDVRVVLTDKPLPDGTKLDEIDYAFPEGVFGMVVEAIGLGYRVVIPPDAVAGIPHDYGQLVLQHSLRPLAYLVATEQILETWAA